MKNKKKLEGIWGWLLLPVIGLIISSVISVFISLFSIFFMNETEYQIYFITFLIGSFFSIYSLILIFNRRKDAPRWSILTIWYFAVIQVLYVLILPNWNAFDLSGFLLAPIIWTIYFVNSKRVKNTFNK